MGLRRLRLRSKPPEPSSQLEPTALPSFPGHKEKPAFRLDYVERGCSLRTQLCFTSLHSRAHTLLALPHVRASITTGYRGLRAVCGSSGWLGAIGTQDLRGSISYDMCCLNTGCLNTVPFVWALPKSAHPPKHTPL